MRRRRPFQYPFLTAFFRGQYFVTPWNAYQDDVTLDEFSMDSARKFRTRVAEAMLKISAR